MDFLLRARDHWLDFLFPRADSVRMLESLSTSELFERLPPAPASEDERIVALFNYQNPLVRDLVWEIKYKGNRALVRIAADALSDVLRQEIRSHLPEA